MSGLFDTLDGCIDTSLAMVLILNGILEHVAHGCSKIGLLGEKNADLWKLSNYSNAVNSQYNRDWS